MAIAVTPFLSLERMTGGRKRAVGDANLYMTQPQNTAAILGGERLPCVKGAVERSETEGLPPHRRLLPMPNRRSRRPESVPRSASFLRTENRVPHRRFRHRPGPCFSRLTVLFRTQAKSNCASQSFSLASLGSSLYTREPFLDLTAFFCFTPVFPKTHL